MKRYIKFLSVGFLFFHTFTVRASDDFRYDGILYRPIEYQGLADCAYAYGPTTETLVNPPSNLEIPTNAVSGSRSKTVLGLRKNAFAGLRMESVVLPKNLVYIGEDAFSQCTILKKVNFTGSCSYRLWSLDKIPAGAFCDCWYLQDINLPSTVQSLGDKAFYNCRSFYSFTLSDNINYIGEKAFAGCDNLRTVISLNLTPPELKSYRTEQFSDGEKQLYDNFNFNQDIKLYVPGNAVESYKNAPGWNQFAYILPLSEIPVSKIELSDRKRSIRLNQTGARIHAEVYPSIVSNRHVEWSSSNDEIVTIEPYCYSGQISYNWGVLFPHKPGKAQIIASIGDVKAVCEVEVTYIPANSISIEPTEAIIKFGNWQELSVSIEPKDSEDYINIWSDNSEIATVEYSSERYSIKAKSPGECRIWFDGGNAKASCHVTVPPVLPDYVILNTYDVSIKPGSEVVLKSTVEPASTTDKTIIWKSDNPYVASVDENGNVTGNHTGICNITAQCGEKISKECVVSVKPESLEFEKSKITLSVGESSEIKLISQPYSETLWDALAFRQSNNYVRVDIREKTITALSPTENIYDEYDPYYLVIYWKTDNDRQNRLARLEVNVPPIYAESLTLTPTEWNTTVGETLKIIPNILPENSSRSYVRLESSNPSVVKTGWSTYSQIEAIGVGEAIIYAKVSNNDHDVTAECHVTVRAPEVLVSSIVLSPSPVEGKEGDQIQISATLLPENATNKTLIWSSSDENVATVDNNGLVSLLKEGTAIITASTSDGSGETATCNISVLKREVLVSSISLDPSAAEGKEGEQIQINAAVLPEDATNKVLVWSSSDQSVASVDDNGMVSLIKAGSATITASAADGSGVSATCSISVLKREVLVSSISLNPSAAEGKEGEQIQINATVLPEDATNKVLVWSSSDQSVASVDDNGMVSLIKAGSATITASAADGSGVSATCSISVLKREVLVSSISLNPSAAEGKEGEQIQINATVLPEDATNKALAWSSSDKSVATVDETGLISLPQKGTAVITASATDGSGISAECSVIVTDDSGIDDILTDKNTYVRVFNLQGVLVYEGIYSVAKLVPDYYIVVCDGKKIKIKVE